MKFTHLPSLSTRRIFSLGMLLMVPQITAQEVPEEPAEDPGEKTELPELPDAPIPPDTPDVPGNKPVGADPADPGKPPYPKVPPEDGKPLVPPKPVDPNLGVPVDPNLDLPVIPLPDDFPVPPPTPEPVVITKDSYVTTRLDPSNPAGRTTVPLAALTLIPDERTLMSEEKVRVEKYRHGSGASFDHLTSNEIPVPEPEELAEILSPFMGEPLSFRELEEIVQMIQRHYVDNGYPLIHVFIPFQEVSNKVKIAVKVGRIVDVGEVEVKAKEATGFFAKWKSWYNESYDPKKLEERVRAKVGVDEGLQPTQLAPVLADVNQSPWARLNRIQQHPYLNVAGKLKPRRAGTNPNSKKFVLGETVVDLVVRQERPLKFFLGYDDSLTELLGEDRFYLGSVWYDAFGLGLDHQLAIQLFTASDFDNLAGVALNYEIPWKEIGQNTEIFAAYVESEATISTAGIPTDIGGSSFIFGARHFFDLPPLVDGGEILPGELGYDPADLSRPLWSPAKKARQSFGIFHEVGVGIDYKTTDNTLVFADTRISDDSADLTQLVVAYNARQTDPNGETNLSWENFVGIGGNSGDFGILRTGADTNYYYTRLKLEREQDLPVGMLAKARLVGQWASDNLLQSEQLGLGGYNSVRGYAERAYRADNGLFFSAEIYSPPLHPLAHFWANKGLQDELRFLAFFDYGTGEASDELVATDVSQTLMSVGLGFRYNVGDDFQFRFDYGFPLEDLDSPPFSKDSSDARAHVGAVWTF